jgi:hypothetical protein
VSSSTSSGFEKLVRLDETLWEIPAGTRPGMRVPARVFADEELLEAIAGDRSLEQLENELTAAVTESRFPTGRTSSGWSRSSSAPGLRDASRDSCRSASSRADEQQKPAA